jgi:hypothetical protein
VGLLALAFLALPALDAQSHSRMPPGMTHEEHHAQMKKDAELKCHGAIAMGFDQDTTTHHFRLTATGGAIEVSVNDAGDTEGIRQIRSHLKQIASDFAHGNFEKPLMTHGQTPPGASTMESLKARITYTLEETKRGAVVRITTTSSLARNAVHDFLRYQIKEHKTGDPLAIQR